MMLQRNGHLLQMNCGKKNMDAKITTNKATILQDKTFSHL
jgi:hypothetical protein